MLEFRGDSDEYCRFCVDEEGKLRPREEVEEKIAEWLMHWQHVDAAEARIRAKHYMCAMPTWAGQNSGGINV